MRSAQSAGQILKQGVEASRQRVPPGDQNIVIALKPIKRKQGRSRGPQAPFGTIALHGAADLAAGGEPDPGQIWLCRGVRRRTDLQRQAPSVAPDATRGAQKIGPDFELAEVQALFRRICQADSFLRPLLRRRDRTLRPPLVSMRARKPWRRLRTILLG